MGYEYSAIPAPIRGEKARDAKTPTDRYALALTAELNRMAADGWEYVRSDVLPSEERSGLTGRATVYHNLLVFRRATKATRSDAAGTRSGTRHAPQPEYPVAASPVRPPVPAPHVPEAAAPQRADHATGTELSSADNAPAETPAEPVPPAPRDTPRTDA